MEVYIDMKKLLSVIIMFLLVISPLAVNVSATDLSAEIQPAVNQRIEYFKDGSYAIINYSEENLALNLVLPAAVQTKTGYKNYSFYNSDDELQWVVTVGGVFTYNGSSATCTESTVSSTVYKSNWKVKSAVASKSGATAIGDFVVKRYTLLVPVQTVNVHLTLTCSPTGTLS